MAGWIGFGVGLAALMAIAAVGAYLLTTPAVEAAAAVLRRREDKREKENAA